MRRCPREVSVVVPYYNDSSTIRRALESVQAQTAPPLEVIICDDASSEPEYERLLEILADLSPTIFWIPMRGEHNAGPSSARNRGYNYANGTWVAFLDSDDSWLPTKLELQTRAASEHPDIVLWATNTVHGPSGSTPEAQTGGRRLIGARTLLWGNPIATSSVLVPKDSPLRFRIDMRHAEDYDLWSQFLSGTNKGVILSESLTCYHKNRFGDDGLSGNLWAMQKGAMIGAFRHCKRNPRLLPFLPVSLGYSILRYMRRLAIVRLRCAG